MGALSGMTGFARCEGVTGAWRWTWEARSVNGKGLEAPLRFSGGRMFLGPIPLGDAPRF